MLGLKLNHVSKRGHRCYKRQIFGAYLLHRGNKGADQDELTYNDAMTWTRFFCIYTVPFKNLKCIVVGLNTLLNKNVLLVIWNAMMRMRRHCDENQIRKTGIRRRIWFWGLSSSIMVHSLFPTSSKMYYLASCSLFNGRVSGWHMLVHPKTFYRFMLSL